MLLALVEDEKDLVSVLERGLTAFGHRTDCFYSAASAQARLTEAGNSYDAIVLDLMLPDGNGADVCTSLRGHGIKTPILVLTARDTAEDKIDLLDRGADDFLSKPFNFDELRARLRALTRRATDSFQEVLTVRELSVNPVTRSAYRGKVPLILTGKEYDVLLYLMMHAGRPVDRVELLAKVWKQTDPTMTNVVDVQIRNLRKKVDEPFRKKYIHTVHGFGYLIRA